MKILGILGSPRAGGNSDILLDQALSGAKGTGATVEKIVLSRKRILGCLDCTKCNETGICVINDDMLKIHQKILRSDGVIHSVPLYFWAMTSQMKAYLDRWCAFFDGNWSFHKTYAPRMQGKRIGLITVCGDANVHTADPIVHSFRETCKFSGLQLFPVVQASAGGKGEIDKNKKAKEDAYELGRKIASF
jgi:multimeric flavodoxin WrbA